jgi:NAD(P)H-dependent flavin oxidoreductase YrpB (nitropropane dioxygenase family)
VKTEICDQFGIDFPLFAFSHCRDVVAAVSRGGGFGVLGAVAHSPEQLDVDLRWIEEQTKGQPYGVDLLVPQTFVGKDEGGFGPEQLRNLIPDEHRQWLNEMLERYDVPPLPGSGDKPRDIIGGMRIEPDRMAPLLDVAFSHNIKLIASALGPPPDHFIERAHSNNIPVAALAGAVEHAVRHQAAGADLIVAQGTEAGGHTGMIATMVLVPEVVDAVAPTPVLAAGGIARGRQLAASLALGADGVWCGSVWLTTEEAETTPTVKQKYLEAGLGDTVRSKSITGKPARMLRSAWTDEWERPDGPGPLPMPLQPALVGEALARIERVAANNPSARQLSTYFVGQVVGSLKQVKPTRRVVLEMVEEFIDTMERLDHLVAE